VSAWIRDNVATVAAWVGMALTLVVGGGVQWSLAQADVERHEVAIKGLEVSDRKQGDKLVRIESDVRSVTEAQDRLSGLVTRQEQAVREMQTLTAELRAHVRVMRGRE